MTCLNCLQRRENWMRLCLGKLKTFIFCAWTWRRGGSRLYVHICEGGQKNVPQFVRRILIVPVYTTQQSRGHIWTIFWHNCHVMTLGPLYEFIIHTCVVNFDFNPYSQWCTLYWMSTSLLKWLPEICAFKAQKMEVVVGKVWAVRSMHQHLTFWILLIFHPSGPRADTVGILEQRIVLWHCQDSFRNSQNAHPIGCLLTNYT